MVGENPRGAVTGSSHPPASARWRDDGAGAHLGSPSAQSGDATAFIHQIQWSSSSPVPGVTLESGSYSDASVTPYWTVTVQAPVHRPFDAGAEQAEAGSFTWAMQTEASLTADGFAPTATVLRWPRYADDPRGTMGVRVRVGAFATQATATATPRR